MPIEALEAQLLQVLQPNESVSVDDFLTRVKHIETDETKIKAAIWPLIAEGRLVLTPDWKLSLPEPVAA